MIVEDDSSWRLTKGWGGLIQTISIINLAQTTSWLAQASGWPTNISLTSVHLNTLQYFSQYFLQHFYQYFFQYFLSYFLQYFFDQSPLQYLAISIAIFLSIFFATFSSIFLWPESTSIPCNIYFNISFNISLIRVQLNKWFDFPPFSNSNLFQTSRSYQIWLFSTVNFQISTYFKAFECSWLDFSIFRFKFMFHRTVGWHCPWMFLIWSAANTRIMQILLPTPTAGGLWKDWKQTRLKRIEDKNHPLSLCVLPPVLTFELFAQKRWKVCQMVIQCDAMMTDEGSLREAAAAAAVNFENCGEKSVLRLAGGVSSYRRPMLWLAHGTAAGRVAEKGIAVVVERQKCTANPSRAFRSHRGRRKHHFLTSSQNCSTAVYSNKHCQRHNGPRV